MRRSLLKNHQEIMILGKAMLLWLWQEKEEVGKLVGYTSFEKWIQYWWSLLDQRGASYSSPAASFQLLTNVDDLITGLSDTISPTPIFCPPLSLPVSLLFFILAASEVISGRTIDSNETWVGPKCHFFNLIHYCLHSQNYVIFLDWVKKVPRNFGCTKSQNFFFWKLKIGYFGRRYFSPFFPPQHFF